MNEAGQMFCEMLGQVCYEEFYENTQSEYQEVSTPFLLILVLCNPRQSFHIIDLLCQTPKFLSRRYFKVRCQLPRIRLG